MKIKLCEDEDKRSRYVYKLDKLGVLRPGEIISREILESILEQEYIEGDWSFLGKYFVLKAELEARAFFITQAGLEYPSFRILHTAEMPEHAMKKLTKAMCVNYKVAYIMGAHRGEILSEKEQKRFDAVRSKAATVAMLQQKVLLDEFLLD